MLTHIPVQPLGFIFLHGNCAPASRLLSHCSPCHSCPTPTFIIAKPKIIDGKTNREQVKSSQPLTLCVFLHGPNDAVLGPKFSRPRPRDVDQGGWIQGLTLVPNPNPRIRGKVTNHCGQDGADYRYLHRRRSSGRTECKVKPRTWPPTSSLRAPANTKALNFRRSIIRTKANDP